MSYEALINEVVEAILTARPQAAVDRLVAVAEQEGASLVLEKVVLPALELFSERYACLNSAPMAQGYVAARLFDEVLSRMDPQLRESRPDALTVVLGNIEDDFHGLGRRMVGNFLQCRGWNVVDLGTDVSAEEFVEAAIREQACVIGVSAMMRTTALVIRGVRDELDKRKLADSIKLAVGGAVFNVCPELVAEVGGDGTAPNALSAASLFERLAKEVKGQER